MRFDTLRAAAAGASLLLAPAALAQTAQPLPLLQDWTNVALITTTDDWSTVPGFIGYRGDDLVVVNATTDARLILADASATPVDVNANATTPGTSNSGGLYEFEIANPVVAFQGSGTSDVPNLVVRVVTTGLQNIRVRYLLRDIDDNADNSIQPVALQFRAGTTGDYTNVDAAYVADASAGPSLTLDTPVDVVLAAAANQQASLNIRWLTYNALGSDELIGIDNIQITGDVATAGEGAPTGGLTLAVANPVRGTTAVRFSVAEAADATLALYDVLGRRVAVLAEGAAVGERTATLATAGLAPGVYVLRLDAAGRSLTQTVTVVR